jgi:hypothetical protein
MKNLEQSLLNAKRFMGHPSMEKNKSNGRQPTITEDYNQTTDPELDMLTQGDMDAKRNMGSHTNIGTQPSMTPKSNMTKESIMSSHLPDAIKKMMIDNPIPDPIPTPNLSEEFIDNVSKKMNSKEYSVDNMRNKSNSNVISESNVKVKTKDPIPELPNLNTIPTNNLKDVIKECLLEILKEENILLEHRNIKENLQLRVGNKLFSGSIKNVKTIKK